MGEMKRKAVTCQQPGRPRDRLSSRASGPEVTNFVSLIIITCARAFHDCLVREAPDLYYRGVKRGRVPFPNLQKNIPLISRSVET